MNFVFAAALITFGLELGYCKRYENYTLFRGIPVRQEELEFYEELGKLYEVDYWKPPGVVGKPVEFIIAPSDKDDFLKTAQKRNMYYTTIIDNVQSEFDKQTVNRYDTRRRESFNWRSYYRLNDIYKWLRQMEREFQSVKVFSIGKTAEKREILGAEVILRGSKKRSTVIIEGGIHAREWIAPAFVTYLMYQIVNHQETRDKRIKEIARLYKFYFIPVLNPDGYEYSHTRDRLWRKNRNRQSVDINRNFDIAFGTVGISKNPKDQTYCGASAFSEKESRAMADFIESKSDDLEYYLAFHSYGQYIILPYAYSKKHMDNFEPVLEMIKQAGRNISKIHGTKYTFGTAYDTVGYTTSGVSGCWAKRTFGVPYVATFELRDEGKHGFALPPKLILPTCEETMEGIVSLLQPRMKGFNKNLLIDKDTTERLSDSAATPATYFSIQIVLIFRVFTILL